MKILFVCTGNTCRSPMAASFLPEDVAESAGLFAEPGDPASPQAIQAALAAGGRDLSGHRARCLDGLPLDAYDWIVTMTRQQKTQVIRRFPHCQDKVRTLGELAGLSDLDIPDPFGQPQAVYDQTALLLRDLVCRIAENSTNSSVSD
jgi:protein-tyrosine-phosphatase